MSVKDMYICIFAKNMSVKEIIKRKIFLIVLPGISILTTKKSLSLHILTKTLTPFESKVHAKAFM